MNQPKPVPSPCVNVCFLDDSGLCVACMRTGREISEWGALTDDQKREVWRLIRQREEEANPPL